MDKVKEKSADKVIVIRKAKAVRIFYWIFQILTLGTLIASIITYFVKHEGLETTLNQIFMCAITLLTLNAPLILERKLKIFIPNYIAIVLYFMLFFHFVLGEVYRAYDHVILFDKILHTTSGVIIAFVSFSIVSILNNLQKTKIKLSPFFIVLFTFCFTMTAEYLWEIFEYVMDSLFSSNMQRWQDGLVIAEGAGYPRASASGVYSMNSPRGSGLIDTMTDMIVNVFGALAVCIYAYVGMKMKPNWFTSRTILTKSDIAALKADGGVKIDKSYYESVGDTISAGSESAYEQGKALISDRRSLREDDGKEEETAAELTPLGEPVTEEPQETGAGRSEYDDEAVKQGGEGTALIRPSVDLEKED